MDRGAWQVAAHGVTRVGHGLATEPHHHTTLFCLILFGPKGKGHPGL